MHEPRRNRYVALAAFLVAVAIAAGLGAVAKPDAWYFALTKPPGTPPNSVFPVVWTALYVLMAIAAWRVWLRHGFDSAIRLWAVQLALNAAWSPVFFRLHQPWLALGVIVALLVAIVLTTNAFVRRDRLAGALMLAYAAWVAYATYLNFGIALANPAA